MQPYSQIQISVFQKCHPNPLQTSSCLLSPNLPVFPVAGRKAEYYRATTACLSPVVHNRVLKPPTVLSLLRIACFRVCAATIATVSELCLLSLNEPGSCECMT
ncbi:uncharacterized protein LOC107643499 [Arachis ipaensis]|uniref:uncharacterized protein LOC107643499 n=1 Tax=Arachis ipaensis TaxID=130454 RepID=UPI0007AFC0C7|nr:uncharacterized protein LOC107643499 [Arachis ipaensis]XP_025654400.1 uncharacterized protein LOC112750082 [Arachis hypogaea]